MAVVETPITGTGIGRPDYSGIVHRVARESYTIGQGQMFGIGVGNIPASTQATWSLGVVPPGWIYHIKRVWATSAANFTMEVAIAIAGVVYARNDGNVSVAIEAPDGYTAFPGDEIYILVTNWDALLPHLIYINFNGLAEQI